ncbi:hydroxyacylglutathione hydrolase [Acidocella sp.]|uniref:hydroxyacylglutathione hydrolase n=1 Tax=Acidocella sp. TaxID=50710 RepID=UPI002F41A542
MTVTATPIPMLSDNYSWLLKESVSGKVAIVDPAESEPAIAAIEAAGGKLDMILLTHHHADHVDGVPALVAKYHPQVVGNAADAHRLPKLDVAVHEGDSVDFGAAKARVIDTPGHTLGHISYFIADGEILLPGDTMFSMGCGRLFEGTAEDMFRSMAKYEDLPDSTLVCAGHEYTSSNAKFALTVDPDNEALQERAAAVTALRSAGKPTLPVTLGQERATNPFLRAPDAETFRKLRTAKDNF